tara:strand:- start:4932 stop:5606 length:675 start_codon:yes stop_codon:yes gene_type:complete
MKSFLKLILFRISPNFYDKLRLFYFERKVLPKPFLKHMSKLTSNDLVIDIGANIGLVSECLAIRGSKVISIEPNSKAFTELEKIAKKYNNIEAHNIAAGTKDRTTKLYLHNKSQNSEEDFTQSSSLLSKKPNVSKNYFEEIKEIDFAKFIDNLKSPIELIKIDIEGYEVKLLNHLLDKKVLKKIKKIYVETHEKNFQEIRKETLKLKKRVIKEGYEEKFYFEWH